MNIMKFRRLLLETKEIEYRNNVTNGEKFKIFSTFSLTYLTINSKGGRNEPAFLHLLHDFFSRLINCAKQVSFTVSLHFRSDNNVQFDSFKMLHNWISHSATSALEPDRFYRKEKYGTTGSSCPSVPGGQCVHRFAFDILSTYVTCKS